MDAYQGQDVAFVNLPGAFLHMSTNEKIIMTLRGELFISKYVCKDKRGKPVFVVHQAVRIIYQLMRLALFFYKLRNELEDCGMIMNPYNMCMANKETPSRHQLIMMWHVDDLKSSCKDKFEVTKLICYLFKIYLSGKGDIALQRERKIPRHAPQLHGTRIVSGGYRSTLLPTFGRASNALSSHNHSAVVPILISDDQGEATGHGTLGKSSKGTTIPESNAHTATEYPGEQFLGNLMISGCSSHGTFGLKRANGGRNNTQQGGHAELLLEGKINTKS
eukprot:CCRYP_011127-RA/>CCRYP_011127-RA protein AED:0.18 eAED:0.38 QI:0/0/0/1/0/0/3/0/275